MQISSKQSTEQPNTASVHRIAQDFMWKKLWCSVWKAVLWCDDSVLWLLRWSNIASSSTSTIDRLSWESINWSFLSKQSTAFYLSMMLISSILYTILYSPVCLSLQRKQSVFPHPLSLPSKLINDSLCEIRSMILSSHIRCSDFSILQYIVYWRCNRVGMVIQA